MSKALHIATHKMEKNKKLSINIVNYEQGIGIDGILTKYAKEMARALIDLDQEVEVSSKPKKADINHHINYESYKPSGGKDTTMITHIDSARKVGIVKSSLKTSVGICFSQKVKDMLIAKGCDKNKLEVVLSAHDELEVRPRIIAVCTNLYPDGRKREEMFSKLINSLKDQKKYTFRIMGKGWVKVLEPLIKSITPTPQFQLVSEFSGDFYRELLNTSDYLLYTGKENALAQSIIDAKYCHLKVIAPPQDDLDVEYPFTTQDDLNKIFSDMIETEVDNWTWTRYAEEHIKIWKKL